MTISAAHLGYEAYSSWKFSKSFALYLTDKIVENKGVLKIPEDVFDFEGTNGEHEISMSLTKNTFINVQFAV